MGTKGNQSHSHITQKRFEFVGLRTRDQRIEGRRKLPTVDLIQINLQAPSDKES